MKLHSIGTFLGRPGIAAQHLHCDCGTTATKLIRKPLPAADTPKKVPKGLESHFVRKEKHPESSKRGSNRVPESLTIVVPLVDLVRVPTAGASEGGDPGTEVRPL